MLIRAPSYLADAGKGRLPVVVVPDDHHNADSAYIAVDPTKLYLAVTVMTAASTVLVKSVRFLEHVSPGCCAGIVNLSISSFSCLR